MGPWNEHKQLERKANVLRVLQQDDLSAWARNYWGIVLDRLSANEECYNARCVYFYSDVSRRQLPEWW